MKSILDCCCGLDVHKDKIEACILKTAGLKWNEEPSRGSVFPFFEPLFSSLVFPGSVLSCVKIPENGGSHDHRYF